MLFSFSLDIFFYSILFNRSSSLPCFCTFMLYFHFIITPSFTYFANHSHTPLSLFFFLSLFHSSFSSLFKHILLSLSITNSFIPLHLISLFISFTKPLSPPPKIQTHNTQSTPSSPPKLPSSTIINFITTTQS
ncbi:hypothetical protein RchiOBHm_Chr3g0488991 [Rosa chinensis]|uniref:Uncharacterized protein n=1 Tax=Rosa chinensis TaxID=74649 RepID=A0A2P6RFW4_ROSCH|nr:hypothetical protein RchiOBHm_Chr3g0488991 [Rosa chinensis]